MNQSARWHNPPASDEHIRRTSTAPEVLDITELLSELPKAPSPPIKREGKKKKKSVFLIALSLMLVAALLVLIITILSSPTITDSKPVIVGDLFPGQGGAQDGALPNMTKEDLKAQMQIAADANYFSFKINTLLVFEDGKSEAPAGIENPNYNVYPMVVQIFLGEDGKGDMIFDSGGILPNQHINTISLSKELPAGEYKALAFLHAYDPSTQTNVFKSTAALTINIKN